MTFALRKTVPTRALLWLSCTVAAAAAATAEAEEPLRIDHYVMRSSELPAIAGEMTELYLRERVLPGTLARSRDFRGRVALFVHGAGTPAEVAFDVPSGSYSWMAHLAAAGFDVFAMDVTGYGRSSRPSVMNDRCNLSQAEQAVLFEVACGNASYPFQLGNIGSDWADIDAVVDYIRKLRGVERVSLLGWSLGGPRAGGYAANNPAKVERLVLLAPAYAADLQRDPPADLPVAGIAMNKQSRRDFIANWDRQVGCAGQYDAEVAAVIFAEMLASDPVGSTWGTGVRRAPGTTVWGWNRDRVTRMRTPTLIVQGIHDAQVTPDRARALYQDLGSDAKVYIDLGCASHNAMWESVHLQMFDASLEWLQSGTVNGQSQGIIEMGYE